MFYVCRHCDRGQIYCGFASRCEARRRSLKAARARHQGSELGRLDHRDHQRAYRARPKLVSPRVMDQGSPPPGSSRTVPPPAEPVPPICGALHAGGRKELHAPCDDGGDRGHVRGDARVNLGE